jgi:endoglucanase
MYKGIIFLFGFLVFFQEGHSQQNIVSYIHVDQFGYRASAKKVAVISDPVIGFNANESFTPSTGANKYQIRKVSDNSIQYIGTIVPWKNGAIDSSSGDKTWWFDFSSLTTPGEYYVYDAGKNVSSYKFKISNNVYNEVLKAAVRMFYYNRCGTNKPAGFAGPKWSDNGINFAQDKKARSVFDKNNASTEKDLSGGWWDAGDFNKYVTFARKPVNVLLTAYSDNKAVWGDNYNIPESGNGIPDIVDEVKWELDFLKKMQLADGSSLIKIGTIRGQYTGTLPPSTDTRSRYYYPGGCSGATISNTSVFAHASLVFRDFPQLQAYADDLKLRAIRGWNNFKNRTTLDFNCDKQESNIPEENIITAGDADNYIDTELKQRDIQLIAAIYLFSITAQQEFKTYIDSKYATCGLFVNGINGNYFAIEPDLYDALFFYTFLPNATASSAAAIKTKLTEEGLYGDEFKFTPNINADGYRAYRDSYNWGSNGAKCETGAFSRSMTKYNLDPTNNPEYTLRAEEIIHYMHGTNPFNIVFLSNMAQYGASNSAREINHAWFTDQSIWDNAVTSTNGPAPGYLVGGPNQNYREYTDVPCANNDVQPCNQPPQKSYLDFNTDVYPTVPSYEISEPAIYYQAAYVKLLSSFSGPVSTIPPITGNGTGLTGNYFNTKDLTGNAVLNRTEDVNFDWAGSSPAANVNNNSFSARWEGEVKAPVTGIYKFATVSDDGVRLWVDGIKIVDYWTDHSATTTEGNRTFNFTAGSKHKIKMEYYESGGNAVAKLLWTVPDGTQIVVPKNFLFPLTSAAGTNNNETEISKELPMQNKLVVYPNPVKDKISIQFSSEKAQEISLIISDVQGRQLKRYRRYALQGLNMFVIPVEESAGAYLLTIVKSDGSENRKFIKE